MGILVDENTRVMVQGITGREGSFHARNCMAYGANVVAGVTPGRGGSLFEESVPVFNSVEEAVAETAANMALIFVPPPFAAGRHRRVRRRGRSPDCLHHRRGAGAGHGASGPIPGAAAGAAHRPQLPRTHQPRRAVQGGHHARGHSPARTGGHCLPQRHPDLRGGGTTHRSGHRPVHLCPASAATPSSAPASSRCYGCSRKTTTPTPWS